MNIDVSQQPLVRDKYEIMGKVEEMHFTHFLARKRYIWCCLSGKEERLSRGGEQLRSG